MVTEVLPLPPVSGEREWHWWMWTAALQGLGRWPAYLKQWTKSVKTLKWYTSSLRGGSCSCSWTRPLTLEVSFRVRYVSEYMVYASSDQMKCFECGDVGHKHLTCPHKQPAALLAATAGGNQLAAAAFAPVAAHTEWVWCEFLIWGRCRWCHTC